jgi:enoyl-[acyl-carrier protein] reductase II
MKNRLTEMLGIEYPIIQGGMIDISLSGLASAVSNAGGLGTLGQRIDINLWHDEIKKTKDLTANPFAVNLGLYLGDVKDRIRIILEEGIKIVVTGGGNPSAILRAFKDAGITTMHVVSTTEQAKKMEAAGIDIVIAEGGESGGIVSKNIISTLVLIPLVADAVSVPVVAAGGIGDARGLIASIALGAQGVQMGSIFEASVESSAPQSWKEAILKARECDTMVNEAGALHARIIKEEIFSGSIMTGQIAGMVAKVENVSDIMARMVGGVDTVMNGINVQLKK